MEFTFSQLKQKEVINLGDGKNLGKVCDLSFAAPSYEVLGFTVTGGKGFRFTRQEVFIPVQSVVKIGTDAILVKSEECPPPEKPEKRRKNECPPPRPPEIRPPRPQDPCPPTMNYDCQPGRRSYDEYE